MGMGQSASERPLPSHTGDSGDEDAFLAKGGRRASLEILALAELEPSF